MTKSDVPPCKKFRHESKRSFAILKKVGDAHIKLGLVTAEHFLVIGQRKRAPK